MFGQGHLAPEVALVHAADLRDRDVGFVGKDDGVVGNELEQGGWRLARGSAGEVARIVFDPVADAGRLEHFEVERGALFEALGFEQFAVQHHQVERLAEFLSDALDRLLHRGAGGDVVGVGVDADLLEAVGLDAGEGIEFDDGFELFAEEGEAPGAVFEVGGPNLDRVAAHAEGAALEACVVAFVLLGDQFADDLALVIRASDHQVLRHRGVGFDRTDAIDAGDGGDDDHVVAFQKRTGGRVAHPVDLFVDLRFLLDVGVGAGHVGFGLVVVVVADEVFDSVVGEEVLEFAVELGGEGLVGRKDDRRALGFLDDAGHGEGLAGAGGAEEDLVVFALPDAAGEFGDRGGLVAGSLKFGFKDKALSALEFLAANRGRGRQDRHLGRGVVVHRASLGG